MPHILRSLPLTLVAVPLLIAGLGACQPQTQDRATVDTTAVLSAVDSIRTAFEEAVKAGDFEKQAAAYATEGILSAPLAPPAEGRDSIQAALHRITPPGATLDLQPIDTRVLGPHWVYEYGIGTLSFTPEGASAPQKTRSTYFALLRRTSAGWKVYREALSLNHPPPSQ